MAANPLTRLLESLEDQPAHPLSVSEWAELCALASPRAHAEPQALPLPALVLTRAARVEVYRERAACGQRLYHPADLWRSQPDNDRVQAGVTAEREANGAPVVEQRLGVRRPT